jgi:hypothetical protein
MKLERIREERRGEERRKLEEATRARDRDADSLQQREQIDALEEKLFPNNNYPGKGAAVSAAADENIPMRERILQRKIEKQARDEAEHIEQLRLAEVENRKLRAAAYNQGRSQFHNDHVSAGGRNDKAAAASNISSNINSSNRRNRSDASEYREAADIISSEVSSKYEFDAARRDKERDIERPKGRGRIGLGLETEAESSSNVMNMNELTERLNDATRGAQSRYIVHVPHSL